MFDDIMKNKTKDLYSSEALARVCPYCKSKAINRHPYKIALNNKWKQAANCSICRKNWTIIYTENKAGAKIVLEK